jgi:hypothetical protein
MSSTILREKGYRFFFFSREEPRAHIPVACPVGEAKYRLNPEIELAKNHGLSRLRLKEIEGIIRCIMKSSRARGKNASAEITHISGHGVWLLASGKELFMPYEEFPWFKDAPVGKILNVEETFPERF